MIPNGQPPDEIKNNPALKGVDTSKFGNPERALLLVTKTLLFSADATGLTPVNGAYCVDISRARQENRRDNLGTQAADACHRRSDDVPGEGQAVHCDRGGRARRAGGVGRASRSPVRNRRSAGARDGSRPRDLSGGCFSSTFLD